MDAVEGSKELEEGSVISRKRVAYNFLSVASSAHSRGFVPRCALPPRCRQGWTAEACEHLAYALVHDSHRGGGLLGVGPWEVTNSFVDVLKWDASEVELRTTLTPRVHIDGDRPLHWLN